MCAASCANISTSDDARRVCVRWSRHCMMGEGRREKRERDRGGGGSEYKTVNKRQIARPCCCCCCCVVCSTAAVETELERRKGRGKLTTITTAFFIYPQLFLASLPHLRLYIGRERSYNIIVLASLLASTSVSDVCGESM